MLSFLRRCSQSAFLSSATPVQCGIKQRNFIATRLCIPSNEHITPLRSSCLFASPHSQPQIKIASRTVSNKSRARKRAKKRNEAKDKDATVTAKIDSSVGSTGVKIGDLGIEDAQHGKRSKGGKIATKKKKKPVSKAKKRKQLFKAPPVTGPTGRLIMTEARWNNDDFVAKLNLSMNGSLNHPKNILNNTAKDKLRYEQHVSHEVVGTVHDQMFMATTTTTFDKGVIANGTTELVCSGLGKTKKLAEFYAAVDLIAALKTCGIDAKNPPDMKAMRQQQEEEQFKLKVSKAQMLLELLGSSRPHFEFDMEQQQRDKKWQANASLWVCGTYFTVAGPLGITKAQAEGLALIEIVNGSDLAALLIETRGHNIIKKYEAIIDSSPSKVVAALDIPPLPYEISHSMVNLVGPFNGKHDLRMKEHARVKDEFEAQFNRRAPTNNRNSQRPRSRESRLESINMGLRDEEIQKGEKVKQNPEKQGKMKASREALPITKIREDLLKALQTEQVVVVSGGTGSGKSTQVPQYILEDAILSGHGANTEIIVTQPRRIAATSVAERVADERDEKIGNSVGYTVRFNRKAPREAGGTIEFVTTGVLLRRIVNDPTLKEVSHVIIDEVHERDINTDFLLILLRDLLGKRPDLRVVLMSATLNADSFANYFSSQETNVQHLSVPTEPRHPVEVFYLEDMSDGGSSSAGSFSADMERLAKSLLQYHDEKLLIELEEAELEVSEALQLEARSKAEDAGLLLDDSDDSDSDTDNDDLQTSPSASRIETLNRAVSFRRGASDSATKPTLSTATKTRAQEREAEDSIVKLVAKLALHLSEVEIDAGRKGSILCFLPGWDEIKEVTSLLEKEANMDFKDRMNILPLHSTIPQEDQQRVFKPAAEGTVKVILSTNIAESSVTIDDVLAVIDGGLVREMNWDSESAMSTMDTVLTSRASATQRLGRAGRVAPGRCYRLYSRGAFEAMSERPAPEIQRTALEATCLSTCSMGVQNGVEKFLGQAMDPPASDAVSYAVDRLVKLGALSIGDSTPGSGEVLTPLGRCLSRFPLDPATSKMLIMGVVMRCLDPVLTAAAGFSSRNTFYNPPGMRDKAQAIRKSFSPSSDTMAQIRAYDEFCSIENEGGWNDACSWAKTNYVSIAAIISIKAVRSQLLDELKKIGLVDSSDLKRAGYKKQELQSDALVNRNADNEMLYTAVLATGLPGNLSSRRQLGSFGTLRTRMEAHTGLHPSSVTFHRKPPKGREQLPSWYLYREMVLSSQVFLRDCTVMTPGQIALFGGYSMDSSDDLHSLDVLDDWIVAESSCDDTMSILTSARRDINAALEYKVMHPRNPLPNESQVVIDGICDMFDVLSDEHR
mmetsp:Transcript_33026/g.69511  ORF Transcript_33026/g.69511 Transcript_33026/m.69511 type:complete len:1352 (-) Transcript_33026:200-4255(-)